MKYEYLVRSWNFNQFGEEGNAKLNYFLNQIGKDGWELVSYDFSTGMGIIKRLLPFESLINCKIKNKI